MYDFLVHQKREKKIEIEKKNGGKKRKRNRGKTDQAAKKKLKQKLVGRFLTSYLASKRASKQASKRQTDQPSLYLGSYKKRQNKMAEVKQKKRIKGSE